MNGICLMCELGSHETCSGCVDLGACQCDCRSKIQK